MQRWSTGQTRALTTGRSQPSYRQNNRHEALYNTYTYTRRTMCVASKSGRRAVERRRENALGPLSWFTSNRPTNNAFVKRSTMGDLPAINPCLPAVADNTSASPRSLVRTNNNTLRSVFLPTSHEQAVRNTLSANAWPRQRGARIRQTTRVARSKACRYPHVVRSGLHRQRVVKKAPYRDRGLGKPGLDGQPIVGVDSPDLLQLSQRSLRPRRQGALEKDLP